MKLNSQWIKVAAVGLLAVGVAGCGATGSKSANSATTTTTTAPVAAAKPVKTNLYLNILTGGQDGKKGWPMFSPADFTVPANATVTVQIRDWDDGTAPLPAASAQYANVTGTVGGTATVVSNDPTKPGTSTITKMDPNNVAHTFTVASLNLNVPLPVTSTTTFTFKTPAKAGTYTWACLAPCGSGSDGMSGAMMTPGYMTGTLTVQ